jgi:hypothetical protein
MFKDMFQSSYSPIYQLKNITQKSMKSNAKRDECNTLLKKILNKEFKSSTEKTSILKSYTFYFNLFSIKESTSSEKESQQLELEILEYHTRAMATAAGIIELENTY